MYTKICGYTALDHKGRMRHASVPLSRSPSPIVNVKQYESEEVPLRYSYVRASNSFHRYGRSRRRNSSWEHRRRQSKNASTEDSSLSSKEDLLDYHANSPRKGKFCRSGSDIWKLRSGCSSSEDLLNDEYDVSDGIVSSGIPETDGSVFSSQEDLLDPEIKCSANVFKFVRSSTSGKGSSGSSSKFSTGEGKKHLSIEKRNVLHKRKCIKPYDVVSKNEEVDSLKQTPASQTPDSMCPTDLSSELAELSPIKLKVQKAVVFTVQRLVNHLSHVCDQVEVISNKCENLQDTFRALECEQHILSLKISDLESKFEEKILSGSDVGKSSSDVLKQNKYSNGSKNHSQDLILDEKLKHAESNVLAKKSVFAILTEILIKGMPFKVSAFLLEEMKVAKKKTSRPYMTKLLVILLVTVIVWDIRSAGSFYGSKLGQVFEKLGLVPYIEVVGRTLKKSFIQSYKWCILNIPLYYSRGCELAGPYLLLVLAKAEAVWGYVMSGVEATSEYIPVIKTKLDTAIPGLSESLIYYGSVGVEGVCSIASSVGNTARPYLLNIQEFMMSRVFVGPLAPENLYQYVVGAFDKVSEVILRVHTNLLMALDDKAHISKTV